MKYFLYLCALLLAIGGILGGAGCRATRPPVNPYPRAAGTDLPALGYVRPPEVPLANATQLPALRGPKRRFLGILPPKKGETSTVTHFSARTQTHTNTTHSPRKCKGCIIIQQSGTGNTATTTSAAKNAAAGPGATSAAKASAPVATGGSKATDQSDTGVASIIDGDNNAPVLTNTAPEASGWQAELARGLATPVGKVLALVLLAGVGYGVYRLWPVLRRRKSDPAA